MKNKEREKKKPTKFTLESEERFVVKMHQGVCVFALLLLKWFPMLFLPILSLLKENCHEIRICHSSNYTIFSQHQRSNVCNTLVKSDWHLLTVSKYWQKWTLHSEAVLIVFSSFFCFVVVVVIVETHANLLSIDFTRLEWCDVRTEKKFKMKIHLKHTFQPSVHCNSHTHTHKHQCGKPQICFRFVSHYCEFVRWCLVMRALNLVRCTQIYLKCLNDLIRFPINSTLIQLKYQEMYLYWHCQ